MTHAIRDFYNYYTEDEVKYTSFLRVDNDTVQLPSEPAFEVRKHDLIINESLKPAHMYIDTYTDTLSVTNTDHVPHFIAYKFEVTVPKKENIYLTNYGLMNGTKSIEIDCNAIDEINYLNKTECYMIDIIFYPTFLEVNRTAEFAFRSMGAMMPLSEFTNVSYNRTNFRGTKELDFRCDLEEYDLYRLTVYFDFEKPFFLINPYDEGYLIPISFLESGNYSFTLLTGLPYYQPTYVFNITNPPPIKIENNILDKEEYYKTIDNSMKLIYDIEFPSNVLYSFNYYFDKNYDSKITEYIYGTNYNEHIERSINLPSSLISNDHKLHYFFNATGLTTETFENSFSLLYHKPIIHLLIDNDKYNPPIYIRSVNDTLSFEYEINDDDPDDDVTTTISIESTSIVQTISKTAPYHETFNVILGDYDLNERKIWTTISATDEHSYAASQNSYFVFIYKFNKPEIEFHAEYNISQIKDLIRIQCKVRDYRGNGMLTIEANLTSDIFNFNTNKGCDINDDSFKDVIIDIPFNRYYDGYWTVSLRVSNAFDEFSSVITNTFTIDQIPIFNAIDKIMKLKHPNKLVPFIYSLISSK